MTAGKRENEAESSNLLTEASPLPCFDFGWSLL